MTLTTRPQLYQQSKSSAIALLGLVTLKGTRNGGEVDFRLWAYISSTQFLRAQSCSFKLNVNQFWEDVLFLAISACKF